MAKEYVEKLSDLLRELEITEAVAGPLEVKHFFSGAALYVNDTMCASWSPVGLAFKLPEEEASGLIASGKAKPLRYFAKGHIKKEYALFDKPDERDPGELRQYFVKAAKQV